MSHPSEAKAPTTIEVTRQTTIEAHTPHTFTDTSATNDMKVTPPIETKVTARAST